MFKYKESADPRIKFKSDLARELTALNFPIYFGDKKDSKAYKTLAFCLGNQTCPIFEKINKKELWIWSYEGSGNGLVVQVETENDLWQGPTWIVESFDPKKSSFQETSVTRQDLAKTIVEGFKEVSGTDYESLFDELIVETDEAIKENEDLIAERQAWIEDRSGKYDDWMKERFEQQITSSEKLIKELKGALDDPELPKFQETSKTPDKKFYLITAQRSFDSKIIPFYTTAFDLNQAKQQIHSRNPRFSKRNLYGSKQEPSYVLKTAKVVKEFQAKKDLVKYCKQQFNIEPDML